MINRSTKLRWRRKFRQRRNQVENLGVQTEESLEQHFFKRLSRLASVRRFAITWFVLLVFLIGLGVYQTAALSKYYKVAVPAAGGTFTEGVLGSFTNANPLYATGPVDSSVSHLVFAGLLKYNASNQLEGDLAESWQIDKTETVYTVKLRPDLKWHDGKPLTADDIVFTFKTIQNPDARSPLLSSWQGIQVVAKDSRTVTFTLQNVLSSFQHGLTVGIIPEHLLGDVPAAQMRSTRFNTTNPVGAGPFKWDEVEVKAGDKTQQGSVGLSANEYYHGGKPDIQRFVISYFTDEELMVTSFKQNELDAISGIETLPDTLDADGSITEYSIPLTAQVMVFFKTSQEILSDVKVRQALVHAVDRQELLDGIGFPVIASNAPFLPIHPGYNKDIAQLAFDHAQATKLLDEAGWIAGEDGIRVKNGKQLAFSLYSQSTSEYAYITQELQSDWREIGVKVEVLLQPDSELQSSVTHHNYDALLYGISLGPDPDVYAYWGSAQADERAANRVNFSEYKSTAADQALEAGRTRTDKVLRSIKYRPFLEAWRNDAPALALYQPRYLYVTRQPVYGFEPEIMNVASDRYSNVAKWKIRVAEVDKLQVSN